MKRALVLPLALLVSACGSSGGAAQTASSTTNTPPTAVAAAPSTTATGSSTAATTTSATTTAPTTAAPGTAACTASTLSLSFVGQQGGMGHGEIGFLLRNAGGASCHTFGYPGIQFLDRAGNPLPTIPHHTTRDFFGSGPAARLVLAPGASASFRLDVGHGVATPAGCATAYGLQVIPPDDTATLRTAIPNGAYECRDANVSPLRAGPSAYP